MQSDALPTELPCPTNDVNEFVVTCIVEAISAANPPVMGAS